MAKATDQVLAEIKSKLDMIALVGEYVRLEKRGANHVGPCPFHDDNLASFSVSAKHKFYHCFRCKESGDAFNFVMLMEGASFPVAVRVLGERVGVAAPEALWE